MASETLVDYTVSLLQIKTVRQAVNWKIAGQQVEEASVLIQTIMPIAR